jgi:hypothetical protein
MVFTSNFNWDLTVVSRDGQLALVVEVKRKIGASSGWATQLLYNIFAHGTFPIAPYFLMVFPDQFYLWTDADIQSAQKQPSYTIDARPILQPYFERARVSANQISGSSLELIVSHWLGEIIYSEKPPKALDDSQHWLIDSGLYAALSGGQLKFQAVA